MSVLGRFRTFKTDGQTVIANDYLKFNYITAQAFIENKKYLVDEEDLKWILGKIHE